MASTRTTAGSKASPSPDRRSRPVVQRRKRHRHKLPGPVPPTAKTSPSDPCAAQHVLPLTAGPKEDVPAPARTTDPKPRCPARWHSDERVCTITKAKLVYWGRHRAPLLAQSGRRRLLTHEPRHRRRGFLAVGDPACLVPLLTVAKIAAPLAILARPSLGLSNLAHAGSNHLLLTLSAHLNAGDSGYLRALLALALLPTSFLTQNAARRTPSPNVQQPLTGRRADSARRPEPAPRCPFTFAEISPPEASRATARPSRAEARQKARGASRSI